MNMKLFLLQLTAAALIVAGAYAQERPLTPSRGSSHPDVADAPDLALGNQCINLGKTAAEHVVKDGFCKPDGGFATSYDFSSNCREVAYSVCKGTIPDVTQRWCPDKTLRTVKLLDLQDKCEDQVDRFVGKPTKKPTKNSKSSKSTRKPTRKPTRRPTRKPTRKPSSSKKCVTEKNRKPSVRRDGQRYSFELEKSNAQCRDKKGQTYSYGEFNNIEEFSDCADRCVNDVRSNLLKTFRGFDWDCKEETCRCLFDEGTLNKRNTKRFDAYNLKEEGEGSVRKTKRKEDTYCGKLQSVKFVGVNGEFSDENNGVFEMESRRALRGNI